MVELRFEFFLLVVWCFLSLIVLWGRGNISSSYKWSIFIVTGYGPLYSLVSFGEAPYIINLSLMASVLILLTTGVKFLKYYPIFLCYFGIVILSPLIIDQSLLVNLPKAILIVIISFAGFNFGVAVSSEKGKKNIILSIAIIYALESLFVIFVRYFFAADLRDAGFALLLVSLSLYLLCADYKYRWVGFVGLLYLIVIQTRSTQFILLLSFFLGATHLKKVYGSRVYVMTLVSLCSLIFFIVIMRTFFDDQLDHGVSGISSSFQTRENALKYEWNKFLESPVFGNGIFYFDGIWRELLEDVLSGNGDDNYAAFNHVGVISTLAQVGISGFLLLIILPILIFNNMKPHEIEDSWIKIALLGYFLSFLISGSPLRTDFPDQFFYMFCIGYCLNFARKYHSKSISENL